MKILNKEDNKVIDVKDKTRIEKLLGYPDKFEEVKGKGENKKQETPVEEPETKEDIKNEEETPVEKEII